MEHVHLTSQSLMHRRCLKRLCPCTRDTIQAYILTIFKQNVIQMYNSANKSYFGLLCAN